MADPSIVDLLKQDINEIATHKEAFIRVSGYEKSGIQIKYRMPEGGKELDAIAQKVERETKDRFARNLNTMIDTIITLCEGVYCQPPGVEEPVELDPEETGSPCLIDERLAALLGMSTNGDSPLTARLVLKRLFHNNDMAIINHAEKLNRWLMDQNADLQMELWQLVG